MLQHLRHSVDPHPLTGSTRWTLTSFIVERKCWNGAIRMLAAFLPHLFCERSGLIRHNEPFFRAWWRALDKLVMNGVVLGPAL